MEGFQAEGDCDFVGSDGVSQRGIFPFPAGVEEYQPALVRLFERNPDAADECGGKASEEISSGGRYPFRLRRAWEFIVRFVAPAVIVLILYFTVGKGQGLS